MSKTFALAPPVRWGLVLLAVVALSLFQAGIFQQEWVNPGGWALFLRFWQASLRPDLSTDLCQLTLGAALTTLAYAVCGTSLSVVLGSVGAVLASQVWWSVVLRRRAQQRAVWWGVRTVLAVPRAIHEVIWGLIFVNIWGLDPLAAVLAIAIPFGAITAKVFAEILDETPRGPFLALCNSGVPPTRAFLYGLLPQAFLNLLSYAFYRFECSIRSAAVLGIIGAGGLGYQMLLSLQSLRYEQLWTFLYALFVLNGSVDFLSALLRRRLGCANRLDLNRPPTRLRTRPQRGPGMKLAGLGLLALILFCFWYVGIDFTRFWSLRTRELFGHLVQSSFPPDLDLGPIQQLLTPTLDTMAMAVLAMAIAGLGGLLLSFPAAYTAGGHQQSKRKGWGGLLFLFARAILLIGRAIPAPIWALVVLFVFFPGTVPGAIALGLHNLGIMGRLMAEVTENLDERPLLALQAQGAPGTMVFLYGVLPLTLPRFLAYLLYRWEVCIRETVIVGLVGAGGLGRVLTEQLSNFDYRGVVTTLGALFILTLLVDGVSARARRDLR
ncbi:PhnE/PtxC family ABC transporter permease [Anthocerotibacter panamensis]|uniref:PhnE/PtxC family ABC transporter permease n=1 Tax=Anthocerotibacter panamensis TaxID=2857077 RepID=UPI001C4024EC|nr:ABC transporter permease subunit [Anthocerotibacter panamensis]